MVEAAPSQPEIPAPSRLVSPKKEPTKAYDAFVLYYDLGDARSCSKVAEKLLVSRQNVDKFRQRWWWDERIAAHKADWQRYFDDELRKQAERMATKVLSLRLEILEEQLTAIKELSKRARLINAMPLTEREITQTSPDGKTEHITIKPVNVKATDGARILQMQDMLLRSLTAQTNPPAPRRGGFEGEGTPKGNLPPPRVEIFIDNGDGTRGKWSDLPPPDVYDPANDPQSDDEDDSTDSLPEGVAPLP